jgi:hypothetical protein
MLCSGRADALLVLFLRQSRPYEWPKRPAAARKKQPPAAFSKACAVAIGRAQDRHDLVFARVEICEPVERGVAIIDAGDGSVNEARSAAPMTAAASARFLYCKIIVLHLGCIGMSAPSARRSASLALID